MIPEIQTVQGPQTSESLSSEATVAEKTDHGIVMQSVMPSIGLESFIDDLSSVGSRGSDRQDCEELSHVGKQSGSTQQHNHHKQEQRTEQAVQEGERDQREGEKGQGERESVRKGQRGKEEGGDAEEEKCKQVKKDVTGWTVVTRSKRQKKMVQIFVKVDEAKVTPMEVSLTDGKVEDVMRQVQKDEDVYVTMHGRVLRRDEKLKSCGVTDGCTTQVTSRLRGGGKHKDKKGQKERKRATKPKGPEQKSEEEPKRDKGPAIQECD